MDSSPLPGSDDHALQFLASEGFLPLALADHPELLSAYAALFAKSAALFALPEDSDQKVTYRAPDGPAASEEGYSKIPDEKSIMTIKISSHCPAILHDEVQAAWNASGAFVAGIMRAIAQTCHLDPGVFDPLVNPCVTLPEDRRTPTLLRMFRYDRPTGADPIVNAEKHKDLGLLSLVVGHSPGLHAYSPGMDAWIPVEEDVVLPPGTKTRAGGLTATLLTGETLAFLTRKVYRPGLHGVVCNPADDTMRDPFRYSIVFTLRPAVAPVWTKDFESDIVGVFDEQDRMEGVSSKEIFGNIKKTHYNVNVAPEIREKQRLEQQRMGFRKPTNVQG